jgi:hypothetical protein
MIIVLVAVHGSVVGTFETCQPVLTMSGVRGRAEVGILDREGQLLARIGRSPACLLLPEERTFHTEGPMWPFDPKADTGGFQNRGEGVSAPPTIGWYARDAGHSWLWAGVIVLALSQSISAQSRCSESPARPAQLTLRHHAEARREPPPYRNVH